MMADSFVSVKPEKASCLLRLLAILVDVESTEPLEIVDISNGKLLSSLLIKLTKFSPTAPHSALPDDEPIKHFLLLESYLDESVGQRSVDLIDFEAIINGEPKASQELVKLVLLLFCAWLQDPQLNDEAMMAAVDKVDSELQPLLMTLVSPLLQKESDQQLTSECFSALYNSFNNMVECEAPQEQLARPLFEDNSDKKVSTPLRTFMNTPEMRQRSRAKSLGKANDQLKYTLDLERSRYKNMESEMELLEAEFAKKNKLVIELNEKLAEVTAKNRILKDRSDELDEVMQNLLAKESELEHAKQRLRQIDSLESALAEAENKIQNLLDEREDYRMEVDQMKENMSDLISKMQSSSNRELDEVRRALNVAQNETAELLASKERARAEARAANERCSEMMAELKGCRSSGLLTPQNSPMVHQQENLGMVLQDMKILDLQKEYDLLQSEKSSMEAECAEYKTKISSLEENIKEFEASMKKLQLSSESEQQAKNDAVANLNKELEVQKRLAADLNAQKDTNMTLNEKLESLQLELTCKNQQIDIVKQQSDEYSRNLSHAEAELSMKNEEISSQNKLIQELTTSAKQLESRYDDLKSENTRLNAELEQVYKDVASVERKAESDKLSCENRMTSHLSHLENENAELLASRERLEAEKEDLICSFRSRRETLESEVKALRDTLEKRELEFKEKLAELNEDLEGQKAITEEIRERLEEELSDIQNEMIERESKYQQTIEAFDFDLEKCRKDSEDYLLDLQNCRSEKMQAVEDRLRIESELRDVRNAHKNLLVDYESTTERLKDLEAYLTHEKETSCVLQNSQEERLKSQYERRKEELLNEVALLEETVRDREKIIAEKKEAMELLQDEKSRIASELQRQRWATETKVDSLMQERDRLAKKAQSIQKLMYDKEEELMRTKTEREKLVTRLTSDAEISKQDFARVQKENSKLQKQLQSTEDEIRRLKAGKCQQENTIVELNEQIDDMQESIQNLKKLSSQREQALRESHSEQVHALEKKTRDLEAQLLSQLEKLKQLQSDVWDRDQQLQELHTAYQKKKESFKRAIEERDEENAAKERYVSACADLRDQLQRAKDNSSLKNILRRRDIDRDVLDGVQRRSVSGSEERSWSPRFGRHPVSMNYDETVPNAENVATKEPRYGTSTMWGEDENTEQMEWKRITELQQRNFRQPIHMQSSYPVETQSDSLDLLARSLTLPDRQHTERTEQRLMRTSMRLPKAYPSVLAETNTPAQRASASQLLSGNKTKLFKSPKTRPGRMSESALQYRRVSYDCRSTQLSGSESERENDSKKEKEKAHVKKPAAFQILNTPKKSTKKLKDKKAV